MKRIFGLVLLCAFLGIVGKSLQWGSRYPSGNLFNPLEASSPPLSSRFWSDRSPEEGQYPDSPGLMETLLGMLRRGVHIELVFDTTGNRLPRSWFPTLAPQREAILFHNPRSLGENISLPSVDPENK